MHDYLEQHWLATASHIAAVWVWCIGMNVNKILNKHTIDHTLKYGEEMPQHYQRPSDYAPETAPQAEG